jgi:hypothetical protein
VSDPFQARPPGGGTRAQIDGHCTPKGAGPQRIRARVAPGRGAFVKTAHVGYNGARFCRGVAQTGQRARFGSVRSRVQISPPRPGFTRDVTQTYRVNPFFFSRTSADHTVRQPLSGAGDARSVLVDYSSSTLGSRKGRRFPWKRRHALAVNHGCGILCLGRDGGAG